MARLGLRSRQRSSAQNNHADAAASRLLRRLSQIWSLEKEHIAASNTLDRLDQRRGTFYSSRHSSSRRSTFLGSSSRRFTATTASRRSTLGLGARRRTVKNAAVNPVRETRSVTEGEMSFRSSPRISPIHSRSPTRDGSSSSSPPNRPVLPHQKSKARFADDQGTADSPGGSFSFKSPRTSGESAAQGPPSPIALDPAPSTLVQQTATESIEANTETASFRVQQLGDVGGR